METIIDFEKFEFYAKQAANYFDRLDEKVTFAAGNNSFRNIAYNIKDKTGNNIWPEKAFEFLYLAMRELSEFNPNELRKLERAGTPLIGAIASCPIQAQYERRNAKDLENRLSDKFFTLGEIKVHDFTRYSLIIQAYYQMAIRNYRARNEHLSDEAYKILSSKYA
jgi:hypothetical protein